MSLVIGYDLVFSVFAGRMDSEGIFHATGLYGSAFYIGNSYFLTCGHTVKSARENGIMALGFSAEDAKVSFASITDSEIFENNDSAIIVCDIIKAKPLRWIKRELEILSDVINVGYPFGFDVQNRFLALKGFKGHISFAGDYLSFPNKPKCYELSFMCPKGISGAPLLILHNGELVICGMTIGNEIAELIVNSFKETNIQNNKIEVYEKTEAYHRGIAVQTISFNFRSEILGGTILDYLSKQGLLLD